MKRLFLIMWISFLWFSSFGQNTAEFKSAYRALVQEGFPKSQIDSLYHDYNHILFWFNPASQLSASIQDIAIEPFPLQGFAEERIYQHTVDQLLADTSVDKLMLGSFLVCAAKDTARAGFIRQKLIGSNYDYRYFWLVVHHILLSPQDIDLVLAFIDKNREEETLGYGLEYFVRLDSETLDAFAIENINHQDTLRQFLAVRTLGATPKTPEKEKLVREILPKAEYYLKGWLIAVLESYQSADLLPLLHPYLDKDTLHLLEVSYRALAASPTPSDGKYLYEKALKQDSIQQTFLSKLFNSAHRFNTEYGLKLLAQRPVKDDVFLLLDKNQFIQDDRYLSQIHDLLTKSGQNNILWRLTEVLTDRKDSVSTRILLDFLESEDILVRLSATKALRTNPVRELKERVLELLADTGKYNPELTHYAIYHQIDTLHHFFEKIYNDSSYSRWNTTVLDYLSHFPKEEHIMFFRKVIEDSNEEEYTMKRRAALALGKLKDKGSVDLIIRACQDERIHHDSNCYSYIEALALIKGEKAWQEIKSFENSANDHLREMIREILIDW